MNKKIQPKKEHKPFAIVQEWGIDHNTKYTRQITKGSKVFINIDQNIFLIIDTNTYRTKSKKVKISIYGKTDRKIKMSQFPNNLTKALHLEVESLLK